MGPVPGVFDTRCVIDLALRELKAEIRLVARLRLTS